MTGDYYYDTTSPVGTITITATDSCNNEASKTVSVYLDESLFPEGYLGEIRLEDTTVAPYNDYLWITFNNKNVEKAATPQVEVYQGGTLKGIVKEFDDIVSLTENKVTYKATLTGFGINDGEVYTVKIIKGSFKLKKDTDYTFYNGLIERPITAELMAPRP